MPLSVAEPKPAADADSVVPFPANDILCALGAPRASDDRDASVRVAGRLIVDEGAAIVDVANAEFPAGPSLANGRWRRSMLVWDE